MTAPETTLTRIDVERLTKLIEKHESGQFGAAARLLRAKIASSPSIPAEQVPPDLVTMNSLVAYVDEATGKESEVVMAYPRDADPWRGRVSILSPVCATLLGLKIGQSAGCAMQDGTVARLKVVAIKYQPEMAGDLHL